MIKTKRNFLLVFLSLVLVICCSISFSFAKDNQTMADSLNMVEVGSVTLQSGTNSYEAYTGTVSSFDYNLPSAYKSNENSWWDYAAYGFSFDKFKAQSLGISDYTNESEVSAAIGSFQVPGAAVPFEVFYTGCLSLNSNNIIYSIGDGSNWVFSASINTWDGTWTLSGSGMSGSQSFAIGQDYNTTSYGGNARHVIRIFVDYIAGKIIVANGNSTGYAVVDCDFANFEYDINYVRFNSQAAGSGFTPCVWVESIMGDNNLDAAIKVDNVNGFKGTNYSVPATISYLGEDVNADITLFKGEEELSSLYIDSVSEYTVRYSITRNGNYYYKDYSFTSSLANEEELASVKLESGVASYEDYIGTVSSLDYDLPFAYKSPENGWYDFAAYSFDSEKFESQTLGVNDWTNSSEISSVIGSYQTPGTAVPFAVYFTGGFSASNLLYSIGNNSSWAISITFNTLYGSYTLAGDCITASSNGIGQDYNTTSYGGNARHVLRIFIDYSAGKLIVANGNNTGYDIFDVNFNNYTGDEINYVRFNANGAASGWVYTQSIMGDTCLDASIVFSGEFEEKTLNETLSIPSATIKCFGTTANALVEVTDPAGNVTSNNSIVLTQYGVYTIKYSSFIKDKIYYREYEYKVLPGANAGASIRLTNNSGIRFGIKILESEMAELISQYGEDFAIGMRITSPQKSGYVEKYAVLDKYLVDGDYRIYYFVLSGFSDVYDYYTYDFTANGFVELNGERYYYDNPATRSISKIAASLRNENNINDFTYQYTDTEGRTYYYLSDYDDEICEIIATLANKLQ